MTLIQTFEKYRICNVALPPRSIQEGLDMTDMGVTCDRQNLSHRPHFMDFVAEYMVYEDTLDLYRFWRLA